jgi:hypothetical protein
MIATLSCDKRTQLLHIPKALTPQLSGCRLAVIRAAAPHHLQVRPLGADQLALRINSVFVYSICLLNIYLFVYLINIYLIYLVCVSTQLVRMMALTVRTARAGTTVCYSVCCAQMPGVQGMRFVSFFRFFIHFHHEAVLGTMQVYTGT